LACFPVRGETYAKMAAVAVENHRLQARFGIPFDGVGRLGDGETRQGG
jgi:hypothetical protein